MNEMFSRGWDELIARDSGPLKIRLIFQPLVATVLAIWAGRRDAREHQPIFFWTVALKPAKRRLLLREAWKDVGKLFLVAVVLDAIYQIVILHFVYPVQTLIVATTLAIVPYLVIRGLTNRILTRTHGRMPRG